MNNLDIFILAVIGISALIALNRGLMKEVFSIIGWTLVVVVIVFMLPIVQPLMKKYVDGETASMVASAILIFVVFFVFWIILTSQIIDKIRASKLSSLDRMLGLFFGVVRACILIILFYIFVGWVMPKDEQPEVFKQSKYFALAGDFAEPIEKLLPKEMIVGGKEEAKQEEKTDALSEDLDGLFEKLVQPKVKSNQSSDESEGYNNTEIDNLDRLIEMTVE